MGPGRHIFPLVEGRKPWRTESASEECMWILLTALNIFIIPCAVFGLPRWRSGKDSACQCKRLKRLGFNLWVRKIPWRRKWQPTPVFLLGKSHGQRRLVSYSPWDHKESDITEQLSTVLHSISLRPPACPSAPMSPKTWEWVHREQLIRILPNLFKGKRRYWGKSLGLGTGEFKMQIIHIERYDKL